MANACRHWVADKTRDVIPPYLLPHRRRAAKRWNRVQALLDTSPWPCLGIGCLCSRGPPAVAARTSTPARGALFAIVTLSIALVRTTRSSPSHCWQSADPVSCSQRPQPPDARCLALTYPSDVNSYVAHLLRCDLGRVPAAHISAHSPTIRGSPGDISHSARARY